MHSAGDRGPRGRRRRSPPYLAGRGERSKLATGRSVAAACRAAGRPDPTKTPIVADTLRGIARQPGAATRQARALTYDQAVELLIRARERRRRGRGLDSEAPAARRARVDAALVALLFCAGLRRAEASTLVWQDVEPTEKPDQLRVRVQGSKANPAAEHADYRLLVYPFARALEELREAVCPAGGDRVIALSLYHVNVRLQRLAEQAGLRGVSSHSGRRGLATELTMAGRVSLRPSVEVGLRHDGGDAETGAGMDLGGGLVVSDRSTGLSVDVRMRMLLVH